MVSDREHYKMESEAQAYHISEEEWEKGKRSTYAREDNNGLVASGLLPQVRRVVAHGGTLKAQMPPANRMEAAYIVRQMKRIAGGFYYYGEIVTTMYCKTLKEGGWDNGEKLNAREGWEVVSRDEFIKRIET